MKKILVAITAILIACSFAWGDDRSGTKTLQIFPVTATYTSRVSSGITSYERTEVPNLGAITASTTSSAQVIDLGAMNIDGYFTFQFDSISGLTGPAPLGGATISVHWRGANVDKASSWVQATQNTIVNAIDVLSGDTDIGYDINDITGVTPFRYMRLEYTMGITGVTPIGILHIR